MSPEKFSRKNSIVPCVLTTMSVLFLFVMLILPLAAVLIESLRGGLELCKDAVTDFYTVRALFLTLQSTIAAVCVNTVFGIFAAWLITRYHFRGKKILTTIIDLPFTVSPVIAGLIFILTFGRLGWMYGLLRRLRIDIAFAVPGVILAVIFVTIPFVARELIPVLNAQGSGEEEAAALMGAGGLQFFARSLCRTSSGRCCTE